MSIITRKILLDLYSIPSKDRDYKPDGKYTGERHGRFDRKSEESTSFSISPIDPSDSESVSKLREDIHKTALGIAEWDMGFKDKQKAIRGVMMAENALDSLGMMTDEDSDPAVLTIREGGNIRGVCTTGMTTLMGDDIKTMMVHFIGVVGGQSKGAGTQLMKAALQWGRNKGATRCILDARPDAEGFYEKIGFHIDEDTGVMMCTL
jgi:GNAT superfamily N-acetyltransferase